MRTEKAAQLSQEWKEMRYFLVLARKIFSIYFFIVSIGMDGRCPMEFSMCILTFFVEIFFVKNIITTRSAALHANISFVMGQLQIFFRIFFLLLDQGFLPKNRADCSPSPRRRGSKNQLLRS